MGCHTCWLSYFTLVWLWCEWTVGRAVGPCTVTWLPNFLEWVAYHIFSPMVLRRARFARESSDITFRDCRLGIFSDNFSRNSCIHVQCTTVCCNRDGCRQIMDEYQTNFKIQKRRHNQRKSWKKEILRSELKFCDVTKCHLIIFCFDERKKILNETILGN